MFRNESNGSQLGRYSAQANQSMNASGGRYNAGGGSMQPMRRASGLGNSSLNAGGGLAGSSFGAAGAPAQGGVAPRIGIQVVNTTATTVSNFDIWGALYYANTGVGTWSNGVWTYNGVQVSAVFNANVTYQALLQSTLNQPFQVGFYGIQVISQTTTASVTDTTTLNISSQTGKITSEPFNIIMSPNQQQPNIGYNYVGFSIDGFTKFTIANVYASSTVQYNFYPSIQVNASNALNGGQVMDQYTKAPTFLY